MKKIQKKNKPKASPKVVKKTFIQYDPSKIEKKWQKAWDTKKLYAASETSKAKKFYPLVEFPFPSGAGLHAGHVRSYTAMDIIARKRRMMGENVLYPIGWDAFGLPTENYAIKTGKQPKLVTKENTDTFRKQLKTLGLSFDWSREINTTDPTYYKWTQWIFLQMYKKGLAYKARTAVNWCPKDKTVLANEEVINGGCERCGTLVEKREKDQWMLAITKYADRLHDDLDSVDYLERIKIQQRNWIGRSEGAEIDFSIVGSKEGIKVFTTRADTLYGVTYVVLAPEHKLVSNLLEKVSNKNEVAKYIDATKKRADIDRTAEGKEKTGVELKGVKAVNPANGEEVPVWIADYVLATYGTGAVMAVPAHDERDYEFATKYKLPVKHVVIPSIVDHVNPPRADKATKVRKNMHAIVFDPKKNKYLIVRNEKFGWDTVIIGGIEEGEEPVDSAIRELREETGYTDVEFKYTLGGPIKASYFAKHKDENRVAFATGLYFELKSEKRVEFEQGGENEGNEVMWVDPSEFVPGKMVNSELPHWLQRIAAKKEGAYTGPGILMNSGAFNHMTSEDGKKGIVKLVHGKIVTKYKLRDWVFSRQRYWGEPIPMVICDKCGIQPLSEKDLPLVLPEVKKYEPTDTGESPLAAMEKWVKTKCPNCKGVARRETDTMPQWAGSSWYYLRYADPKNKKEIISSKNLSKWQPVDWYNGGMEHTTLHLLYSRFWHKFLFDIGVVKTKEPYMKRTSQGMVLAEGGAKMSKSVGNVVNPDAIVKLYGADTLRMYEMFMGPFDQAIAWNSDSMIGPRRFIERVWNLSSKVVKKPTGVVSKEIDTLVHKTIKKVGDDIETMGFNTAISSLMILLNAFEKEEALSGEHYGMFLQLIAPFAPHVAEELWQKQGKTGSIHRSTWPSYDNSKLISTSFNIAVQINGKVRAIFVSDSNEEDVVKKYALEHPDIVRKLDGKTPTRVIYVPNKLVNIVVPGL